MTSSASTLSFARVAFRPRRRCYIALIRPFSRQWPSSSGQLGLKLLDREGIACGRRRRGCRCNVERNRCFGRRSRCACTRGSWCWRGNTAARGHRGSLPASAAARTAECLLRTATGDATACRLRGHHRAVERLFDDEADLILHRVDKADPRLEWIDLGTVSVVPVVAPGFLPFFPSQRRSRRR